VGLWVTGLVHGVGRQEDGKIERRQEAGRWAGRKVGRKAGRKLEVLEGVGRCRSTKKDSVGGPRRAYISTRDLA
jgi:hypothetical protein